MTNYIHQCFSKLAPPEEPTKIARVLHGFCMGRAYTLFEAQEELHDRSLHSTVSALKNEHRVAFIKKWVTKKGYQGHPTRCVLYRIDPTFENLSHCLFLLKSWGYTDPEPPNVLIAA